MKKIKIGVLCPSEIAYRRFMPALLKHKSYEFVGVAHANEEEWFGEIKSPNDLNLLKNDEEKAVRFCEDFKGKLYNSYKEMIYDPSIEAIYIPLPPALHFKWAKVALENGKHVFLEKPSTTSIIDTRLLVDMAKENSLALHENYMFSFHSQIEYIENLLKEKVIGDIRLIRISFGFPFRGSNDFRYNKKLGGGSLLDCGGYTLKLATRLLGPSARLICHKLNYVDSIEVDLFGSGTMINDQGVVAQLSFGMDNSYKCDLEIWGQKGTIFTGRILTAPVGYEPIIRLSVNNEEKNISISADDSFYKSLDYFTKCISDKKIRHESYDSINRQASLVEEMKGE